MHVLFSSDCSQQHSTWLPTRFERQPRKVACDSGSMVGDDRNRPGSLAFWALSPSSRSRLQAQCQCGSARRSRCSLGRLCRWNCDESFGLLEFADSGCRRFFGHWLYPRRRRFVHHLLEYSCTRRPVDRQIDTHERGVSPTRLLFLLVQSILTRSRRSTMIWRTIEWFEPSTISKPRIWVLSQWCSKRRSTSMDVKSLDPIWKKSILKQFSKYDSAATRCYVQLNCSLGNSTGGFNRISRSISPETRRKHCG